MGGNWRQAVPRLALFAMAATLGACAGPHEVDAHHPPDHFTITLSRRTDDRRYTLLEVDRNGVLSFAGGKDAVVGKLAPVGPLSLAQRQQVWAIIVQYRLTEAPNHPFDQAEHVIYELQLDVGHGDRYVRAVDDGEPGIAKLHDALFAIQADTRYTLPEIQDEPKRGKGE